MATIFNVPFATAGDRETIPQTSQPDGLVSFAEGYPEDYQLDPAITPDAKDIERAKFNGLMHAITEALFEIQRHGAAFWGAAATPYPVKARVYYDGAIWSSTTGNNNQTPGAGGNWALEEILFSGQTQALAGENNSSAMTPLRVHQAVQQFGLGADALPSLVANDVDVTRAFRMSASDPANPGSSVLAVLHVEHDTDFATQEAAAASSTSQTWKRARTGSGWQPWRQVWNSGTQLALGTTSATARTALELGDAATRNRANQAQAETGASNDVLMTPSRSSQHLDANVEAAVAGKNLAPATVGATGDVTAGGTVSGANLQGSGHGITVPYGPSLSADTQLTAAHVGRTLNIPGGAPAEVHLTMPDPTSVPVGSIIFVRNGGSSVAVIDSSNATPPEGRLPRHRAARCMIGGYNVGTSWTLFGDLADA